MSRGKAESPRKKHVYVLFRPFFFHSRTFLILRDRPLVMSKGPGTLAGEVSRPLVSGLFTAIKSEPVDPPLFSGTRAMSHTSLVDALHIGANDVLKTPDRQGRKQKEKQSMRLSSPIEISSEDDAYTPKAGSLTHAVGQSK
jgi:hypothetical protein